MESELHVFMDLGGESIFAGRFWVRDRSGRVTSSFVYSQEWLGDRRAFAFSPTLMLTSGTFHANTGLFNAFADSAPDNWGRKLMRRHERLRAQQANTQPCTLSDIDFLARVDDQTRMGAMRFKDPHGSAYLTQTGEPVPPLINLPDLLAASRRFERGRETNRDIQLVLAPGTSMGGARPKATIRDGNGQLLIAKFTKQTDDWPVILWEAATLEMAARIGLNTPQWRLERVARQPILMLTRFDRADDGRRIPFMSAMTAIDGADHGEQRSYLELADFLRQEGAAPEADLTELWRRIVFYILVSNTDDHLRNHAFLRSAQGWRLSPLYDVNPCPVEVKHRIHVLAINETDATASIDLALSVANYFGLKKADAIRLCAEIADVVFGWRDIAKTIGLKKSDLDFMASAFEHTDLHAAMGTRSRKTGTNSQVDAQKAPHAAKPKGKAVAPKSPQPKRARVKAKV